MNPPQYKCDRASFVKTWYYYGKFHFTVAKDVQATRNSFDSCALSLVTTESLHQSRWSQLFLPPLFMSVQVKQYLCSGSGYTFSQKQLFIISLGGMHNKSVNMA